MGNTARFDYAIQVVSSDKAAIVMPKQKVPLILIPN